MTIPRSILFGIRNVSDKVAVKIKTHILCPRTFFLISCRLWKSVEKYGRARSATEDNIIRRMRIVRWITKATDTHSGYVILIAFLRQQRLRERASTLRLCAHCLSCFAFEKTSYQDAAVWNIKCIYVSVNVPGLESSLAERLHWWNECGVLVEWEGQGKTGELHGNSQMYWLGTETGPPWREANE